MSAYLSIIVEDEDALRRALDLILVPWMKLHGYVGRITFETKRRFHREDVAPLGVTSRNMGGSFVVASQEIDGGCLAVSFVGYCNRRSDGFDAQRLFREVSDSLHVHTTGAAAGH